MKIFSLFFALTIMGMLCGCTGLQRNQLFSDPAKATVVFYPTDANTILSCLASHQDISRKEFKALSRVVSDGPSIGAEGDVMRRICLSLHPYAGYKQFKAGMESLSEYIKNHPDDASSLQGIHLLMERVDQEKVSKWALNNRSMDEKEAMDAENKELLERNEMLEKNAAQDQIRINELQKQIEQLKNIENIIKNREH